MNIMPRSRDEMISDGTRHGLDGVELFPLSQGQLSFWLSQMLNLDDPAFNIGECVEILGAVDPQHFELALRRVVKMTDALHLRILETENGPRQYFKYEPAWELIHLDFSTTVGADAAATTWMRTDMARAFRLEHGPLYRFALIKIASDRYLWYAVNHHIINDGIGWRLLLGRVATAYTAITKDMPADIETGGSWSEVVAEELAYRTSDHYRRDRTFWKEQLSSVPPRVTLSGKSARRPLGFIKSVGWIPRSLDLDAIGRRFGANTAAVLVATTAIYLHRMTGAHDMMLAMPVGARVGPKMRSIVGMAANAVPLRLSISPEDYIGDIVQQAARGIRAAMRHQRYRIEDMRSDLGLSTRDGEIAGTLVNFTPLDDDIMFDNAKILRNPLGNWWVEDLEIVFYGGNHPSGLRIDFIANPEHYRQEDLAQHRDRFINFLSEIAVLPADTPVACARIFSSSERQQVLYEWNATDAEYPSDQCIHELFEEQTAKTPEAIAVIFESEKVSYAELNARANRLAHRLIAQGVKPDERVAIALERSVEMVVALLATLKAGGAYVPLDPGYPIERLQFMLQDSTPRILLTQETVFAKLGEIPAGLSILPLDGRVWPEFSALNPDPRALGLTSSNLAYVIYTSGSTGTPKGIDGLHRGLVNRLAWMAATFPFDGPVLIKTSIAFIDGITELLGPLICGATAVLADPKAGGSPAAIIESVERYAIGRLTVVPSLLATILEEGDPTRLATCKLWVTSGAALPHWLARRFRELLPDACLLNLYGTSEASGDSLYSVCTPDDVPIGRPIWNTRAYVLNDELQPAPVGIPGILYLAGEGIAAGYHGKSDLIAKAFLPDPYGPQGSQMYRTGDLARWRPSGTLEFLGRSDDQVKLNGIRIELGEIETVLCTLSSVRDAAVVAIKHGQDGTRLVAFIVWDPAGPPAEIFTIRAGLAARLPEAFIPSAFVTLPELPRLPNGKLDRRRLAESHAVLSVSRPSAAPLLTTTEFVLAEIWSDNLRQPIVNRDADYFELGGDSLRATILMARVRKVFALELPLSSVFEAPTLEALASRIDAAAKKNLDSSSMSVIERIRDDKPTPLSFSQHRMWLIHALDPSNSAYNMSGATRLIGKLDINALSQAIDTLRRRHEILRTTYEVADEEVVQRVHEWKSEPLQIADLTEDFDAPEAEATRRANVEAASPIDLAKGPVFNCVLMRLGPEEHVLQTTVHHIAGDQWSFGILGRELAALYNAARSGHLLNLPPHELRYRDFAHWQRGWLEGPEMASHLQYWRRTLQNITPLNLPTDRQRPRIQSLRGTFCLSHIPAGLIEKLEQLGRRESTTLFMTMFAGFLTLLHRLSNQTDIVAGVPVANRTHSAVEKIVGTFVNTLAFRVDLSNDPTFSDLLDRVRAVALDAFAHQDVPFDKLVQEILPTRDSSRPPLVQVMFNMLNAPMHGIELDGISWEPILIDRGGAQFELSMSVDCQISRTVAVEYNRDLFERSTIERFIERYLHILEVVVASPQTKLSEIDILPPSERRLLLKTWNATNVPAPRPSFIEMFEARAAQLENTTAVTFEDNTLTYGELNSRANALAHELRALGADKGSIIGVCLERSLNMLVALLAVQKSGGAYVPLDPRLPERRLEYMIADSGLSVLIATEDSLGRIIRPNNVQVVDPRSSITDQEFSATPNPERHVSPSDPAYIIYTSGSTGKPKAVVVSHGALSNLLCAMEKRPGLQATDVMAAVTTISFDIAGLELYLPLLVGARIELIATPTANDAHALSQHLDRSGATVMQATPATWQMLLDAGWKGGTHFRAFCGGETLPRGLANTLLKQVSELWNLYGPTETTIWSTAGLVQPGDDPISIGKPIDNTRVYILDGDTPAPIGITGEICIAGDGVATGYHGQSDLTAARFGNDPFVGDARVYRTGDLGRWGNDGQLYHMGRMDHQVKVRGFRIELGEIETVLRTHPAVREAIIVSREVGPSDSRLVAFVIYEGNHGPTTSEVRRYLRQQLPDYMVPSLFVTLDRLPLTSNGKIDRNILPDPFAGASEPSSVRDVPAPGGEALIADIWREMLKIDRVTAEDNFFDLGGHSLLALRVVAQIEKRTGTRLDPRVLFFQNLRQIAASLPDVEVCH